MPQSRAGYQPEEVEAACACSHVVFPPLVVVCQCLIGDLDLLERRLCITL
jgi:hypothetical protein